MILPNFTERLTATFRGRWLQRFSCALLWLVTSEVHAGMPSPRLIVTELGQRRLEEISFFFVGFLVLTGFFRWVWNGLAREIPSWPILSFRAALSLMLLWGLALTVILSLVSGARELMTPAAWEPNGITYRLTQPGDQDKAGGKTDDLNVRRQRMERLKQSLWDHARQHAQSFPDDLKGLPSDLTVVDPVSEQTYLLTPNLTLASPRCVLVSEPDVFPQRLLLLTDGTIATQERSEQNVP